MWHVPATSRHAQQPATAAPIQNCGIPPLKPGAVQAVRSCNCGPANFYEGKGHKLDSFPASPNAVNDPSFVSHLLVLPTGQILFTDFTTDVEILTTAGTYKAAWQPTIHSAPASVSAGVTNYSISGTQFNGMTQGAAYGDDVQDATNYPLVRIVNRATGHVFYCKTHNHSSMGVATGHTSVSTK